MYFAIAGIIHQPQTWGPVDEDRCQNPGDRQGTAEQANERKEPIRQVHPPPSHRAGVGDSNRAPAAKNRGHMANDNRHTSTATARTRRRDSAASPRRRYRREDRHDEPDLW